MNEVSRKILEQVNSVIIGKEAVTEKVLMAVLAQGHVLLEDVPGVGKTTMALAFARTLGLDSRRVQFTSDTMPSDIIGFSLYNKETGRFDYKSGAVMTNLLLADEINRTSSKTQSALLEAMEEYQVTVDGHTYPLPKPFVVLATQNPVGSAGTQLLPDSQVDRFTLRLTLGYPAPKDEAAMIKNRQGGNPLDQIRPILTRNHLLNLQAMVAETYLSDSVIDYLVSLCAATRKNEDLSRGASPRASLSMASMAKAIAQLRGRDFVVPGDVKEVFLPTVAHRVQLSPKAESQGKTVQQVLKAILDATPAPRLR